jgi:hypothetical protein
VFAVDIHTRLLPDFSSQNTGHFLSRRNGESKVKHWQKACHPHDKKQSFFSVEAKVCEHSVGSNNAWGKHLMKYIQSVPHR